MLGGELLMALAQGEGLRGLDETASAVGVFLDIHQSLPPGPLEAPAMTDLDEASARTDVGKVPVVEKGVRLAQFATAGAGC